MDKIARLLPYVSHKDEVVGITEPIDPGKLLPGKLQQPNDRPGNLVIVSLIKYSVYSSMHSVRDMCSCCFSRNIQL